MENQTHSVPRIGEKAPAFTASTTQGPIRFPDDFKGKWVLLFSMIHPGESGTKAVRAVFFIDPDAVIRAIIYYPLALGRNFDELRRVLVGLQTIDRFHVSLPADWRPGDEVVVPSPGTMDALDRQEGHPADGVTCHDWFFCTRKLTEEEQQEMAIG